MSTAEQIAEEWRAHKIMRENYFAPNDQGGITSFEIVEEWKPFISFDRFVFEDRSIDVDAKKQVRADAGYEMPYISSVHLTRFRHPKGYHYFQKFCSVAKEEWLLAQFAHACDFSYAPVLLDDKSNELYTPKLGHNLTSLYGFLISALKRDDDSVPKILRDSFNKAVTEYGAPHKIPYRALLNANGMGPTNSNEFKAYREWVSPLYEREKVFLSKMRALLSLTGTQEGVYNPSNIIVNPQTGRFIYAIDQTPIRVFNYVSLDPPDALVIDGLYDADVVEDMQRIMRESMSDEFVDLMIDCIRDRENSDVNVGTVNDVKFRNQTYDQYRSLLKHRLDNPYPVVGKNFG